MAEPNFNPLSAGKTIGAFCVAWTIALWLLSGLGFYTGAATFMTNFHLFFQPGWSILGLILGTVESAVYGFIGGYGIAWLYNKL